MRKTVKLDAKEIEILKALVLQESERAEKVKKKYLRSVKAGRATGTPQFISDSATSRVMYCNALDKIFAELCLSND